MLRKQPTHPALYTLHTVSNGWKLNEESLSSKLDDSFHIVFSILGCTGATSPINTGLAPSSKGCHGCHKGATGDPPMPSLFREGAITFENCYNRYCRCICSLPIKGGLGRVSKFSSLYYS